MTGRAKLQVNLLCPTGVYICDGSEEEAQELTDKLVDRGMLVKLDKLDNCYLCRTDPADVARVESKTFIVTPDRYQTVPHVADGCKGILGQWMSPDDVAEKLNERLPGSMKVKLLFFTKSYFTLLLGHIAVLASDSGLLLHT